MQRTYHAKPDEVARQWYVVDMEGKTLGHAASEIAKILRGKNKPEFTPHVDTGDFVVAINAHKLRLSGRKWERKRYYHHTGYIGGLKTCTARDLLQRKPTEILVLAVRGMLPKNVIGKKLLRKLKVYAAAEHPHQAQQPQPLEIGR